MTDRYQMVDQPLSADLPPQSAPQPQVPSTGDDMVACVMALEAALLPCLPARELQAIDRSSHPSHQIDVERHARDFMEAAKKLQLYFIGLQRENQPSKVEMLKMDIATMEEELKIKTEIIKKQEQLIQGWRRELKDQLDKHNAELEKVIKVSARIICKSIGSFKSVATQSSCNEVELCRAGSISTIAKFLQLSHHKHSFLSDKAYNILLTTASEKNDIELLLQIFKYLLVSSESLGSQSYLNLAKAFAYTSDCIPLLTFVTEVLELAFQRRAVVMNRILYAFSEYRLTNKAVMIYNHMKILKFKLDLVTYNAIFGILGRASHTDDLAVDKIIKVGVGLVHLEQAEDCYHSMQAYLTSARAYSLLAVVLYHTGEFSAKWVDAEREWQARRVQTAQSSALKVPNADASQHSLKDGAMLMGCPFPYNKHGNQSPENFGFVPYQLPSIQNQPIPSIIQGHGFNLNIIPPEHLLKQLVLSATVHVDIATSVGKNFGFVSIGGWNISLARTASRVIGGGIAGGFIVKTLRTRFL
ncbi:hypothetical protein Nepgr_029653 [Nepenthes gracilis]|uniref:Uncharacterized protein n=1 Tax=Nepenthes gracilis TaxID=150966 RepID=A0AAD3Y518_NEPGR|nr:hypothetical protein Nepgr_029653 [Nepenthes gracilis]